MSNSNSNPDSIAKQLAQRRARLQESHSPPQNRSNNPSNQPNPPSATHVDDLEYARQLQAQFDAERRSNHRNNNQNPNHTPPESIDDSDIELLDNDDSRPNRSQSSSNVVDTDHEIALQLQRQFDNEESNVPDPSTHNPNYNPQTARRHRAHTSPSMQQPQTFQIPSNLGSYSFSSSNPTGNRGGTTIITSQMGPNGRVVRTVRTNANNPSTSANNPNQSRPHNPFDHPFFQQHNMPGMSGFNHPFFQQHNHNQNPNNNNANPFANDPFFAQISGASGMPMMQGMNPMMNMNMMVNNLMMGDPMQFTFMQPRPQVANQQNVDALPTDTYKTKSRDKEAEHEEEKDAQNGCSEEDKKETCSICLEEFKDGEEIRRLPCFHIFHRNEIDRWLLTGADKCPICRVPINGQMQNQ